MSTHLRPISRPDLPAVVQIDRDSFDTPRTEGEFLALFRRRRRPVGGLVAERGCEVVGYVLYAFGKSSLHVVRLAVRPASRRRGVAAALLGRVLAKAAHYRGGKVRLEVHERNLPAQLLYRSLGFRATRVVREMYGPGEDGYRMSGGAAAAV